MTGLELLGMSYKAIQSWSLLVLDLEHEREAMLETKSAATSTRPETAQQKA